MARKVQGKTNTWQLSDVPIGSGDAGEVFAVACVDQPDLTGVMKKPSRIATSGTIQRQAGQIAQESLALARLEGLPQAKAHPPRLLDQAPEFTEGTANYFIVSETAPGEDLASLLTESRQAGKPFPRRVIITVLDALFDLFSRAHQAGVLWNDVKLEHIYWHNPTGQVAVIDWGNALFIDQSDNRQPRSLPRWEDYRQMVDTLGSFLQQSAPELYADLGWDEFQGQELDAPRISVLARRIAYQQQVVGLKVMEYQSLIRVILSGDPSLEGLEKILNFQQTLAQIGAPWTSEKVLNYSQSLVETSLAESNIQSGIKATALTWEIFGESLGLSWHLVREYFRSPDILTDGSLESLVNLTLNENWSDALWTIVTIARDVQDPPWWDRLVPVLRQKALGLVTPPPYQTCQSLLDWTEAQGPQYAEKSRALSIILQNWRSKGEDFQESPFDYALLDLLHEEPDFPRRISSDLKKSFAAGEEAIRELLQVWVNMNWEALPKAFRRIVGWDPDRWGIVRLAECVSDFQVWLSQLFDGPELKGNIRTFLQHLLNTRPPIERMLGTPPWFKSLMNMLNAINQGAPVSDYHAGVQNWCPWLIQYMSIAATEIQPLTADENSTHAVLSHFAGHLKTWSDIEAGLKAVKENAPDYHPLCKKFVDGFQSILSLNINLNQLESLREQAHHPALAESNEVLKTLINWRKNVSARDLSAAIQTLADQQMQDWRILEVALEETTHWHDSILPILQSISTFSPPPEAVDEDERQKSLIEIAATCVDIQGAWLKVYKAGVHSRLLETLEESIENARTGFFAWRHWFERSSNRVAHFLYHSHLESIRQVSDNLLRLTQHSRQSRFSFSVLGDGNETTLALQIRACENILDHLYAIESILISEPNDRHFPDWQSAFKQIINTNNTEARQKMVLSLSQDHPFNAWMLRSFFPQ